MKTLQRLVSLSQRFDLVKMLAWAQCASSVLQFKLNGRVSEEFYNVEHVKPIFDWQSLSELDAFIAWTGIAFSCQQECSWFTVSEGSINLLQSKRFAWWLADCYEAALYCGLINRAAWSVTLVGQFFVFAKNTLNIALPIAYRMEALVRAQRGEDKLALKALTKDRYEAKRLNLLFESRLCAFIFDSVFRDQEQSGEISSADDFGGFGCSEEFADNMRETLQDWIAPSDGIKPSDRWTIAKASVKKFQFLTKCFAA